jgi:ADP-ribose pyrophosphatase YjhB (NUDIX family)
MKTDQFRDSFKYCRYCGGLLEEVSHVPVRLRCINCRRELFLNPKVGVALLIEKDGALLLARRAENPFKGWWTLPAGYVEYEETCEQAAIREAREELSTPVRLRGIHGVYSYGDDPRSRMVLIVYRAECSLNALKAGDDVSECKFFAASELPENIAFEGIESAIADWQQEKPSSGPRS